MNVANPYVHGRVAGVSVCHTFFDEIQGLGMPTTLSLYDALWCASDESNTFQVNLHTQQQIANAVADIEDAEFNRLLEEWRK